MNIKLYIIFIYFCIIFIYFFRKNIKFQAKKYNLIINVNINGILMYGKQMIYTVFILGIN